jgi:hypothetical protein
MIEAFKKIKDEANQRMDKAIQYLKDEFKKMMMFPKGLQSHLRIPLVPVNWGHGRPWGGSQSHLLTFFPEDEYSLVIPKSQEVPPLPGDSLCRREGIR